jgi:uncharacterized protein YecT (DUF1311 family)
MKNNIFITLTFIFSLSYLSGFAQATKTVESLETQYQNCLDKGQFMLGCSATFYAQMDSLLNLQYNKLRSTCDSEQKENLKDEQMEWLSKRDKQFKQIRLSIKKDAKKNDYAAKQDEAMILADTNAKYVKQRVIDLINSSPRKYAADKYKVNPTGYYSLDNKTETKNGETYGYFGDIELKEISKNKIVMRLFVCRGAPGYNSGTLTDTLVVINNKIVYTTEYDPSCKLIFTLYRLGIMVEQFADDPNFACGFGHAVDAYGFYKKKSSKIPTDKELMDE